MAEKLLSLFHPFLRTTEMAGKVATIRSIMRRTSRREHAHEPGNPAARSGRRRGGSKGPWEFASERLFAVGETDAVRRAAYRAADGELRFLPL